MLDLVEIDGTNEMLALEVTVSLDQVPFVADGPAVAETILAKCAALPDGHLWTPYLAIDEYGPVGVVAVVDRGDDVQLRHMAIDHRRQGVGLGLAMLESVIEMIRRSCPGCRSVMVTTHPDNEVALALYESAGFVRTGAFAGIEPVLALDLAGA